MNKQLRNCKGFTLLELVVVITILAIGTAAFLNLIINVTKGSIDPQINVQANAIAQSYLEEVMLNNFCDPDLMTDCPAMCTASNVCANCSQNTGGLETRATFDDVCDYNNLPDTIIRDQQGTPIAPLGDYRVTVAVDGNGASLGGLSSTNGEVVRIDVNVTHPSGASVSLSGFRANF